MDYEAYRYTKAIPIEAMDRQRSPLKCTSKCTQKYTAIVPVLAKFQEDSVSSMVPTRLCMCKHCVMYRLANFEIC